MKLPFKISRDSIFIGVLFTLLAVLNITSSINTQRSLKIRDDTLVTREYLGGLMGSTGVCVLLTSGAVNTGEVPFEPEAINAYYVDCLEKYSTPPSTTGK